MTDIWRSFVAQAALWSQGQYLTFQSATVIQERNQHDLMKDFRDEVDGYLRNGSIVEELTRALSVPQPDFTTAARVGWEALLDLGVIQQREFELFDAWVASYQECL